MLLTCDIFLDFCFINTHTSVKAYELVYLFHCWIVSPHLPFLSLPVSLLLVASFLSSVAFFCLHAPTIL